MLLHDSRRDTRVDPQGRLVTLEDQDRSRWDRARIGEGLELVDRALRMGRIGTYQLQAAIAALHSQALSPAKTDWRQIAALYQELLKIAPSPVVALNHAVAVAMSDGLEPGLAEMERVGESGGLEQYYLYHAARADILRRLGRKAEAASAYQEALQLATNKVEQDYLRHRLSQLQD
jgi:RNA polymerase sigma-70 factor (ECF subfamily)